MTTTTQMSRIRLMSTLNVDDTGFQSLLDIAGLDDADNFTEEEVRALNNAYVTQNSNVRNRSLPPVRSLPSPSAPVGESQSTGTSQIAGGFQELLDGQYEVLQVQVNSALASHRGRVEDLLGEALDEALDIPFQIMEGFQESQTIGGTTALTLPGS